MNYWPQRSISSGPVTVTVDDRAFWCDATSVNITLNLPSVVGKAALYFVFKKTDSSFHTVTVNAPSGKTIDGAASYTLSQQNQIIGVVADTTGNYYLVDGNSAGSAVGLGKAYIVKTDGDFGLGGLTGVPSTLLSVNLPIDGDVIITVSGTAKYSGQPTAFSLGVRVDSITDYVWDANESQVGAGGDYFHTAAISHRFVIPSMAKGTHLFQMIASGNNMTLQAHSGEPASMVVEYTTVINFGGGNPTADPTNDLSGTWDTVQVVGLQNDKLPTKTAGGFLRRKQDNTGWEEYTDITNVELDAWRTPRDITLLNSTRNYHGLLPKLPTAGGGVDITNFLRADGTWATPPGSGGGGSAAGTIASRPSTATDGSFYLSSDHPLLYRMDVTTWQGYNLSRRLKDPNQDSFTWVNQGSATAVTEGNAVIFTSPHNNGNDNINFYQRSAPGSTPYTFDIAFYPHYPMQTSFVAFGIAFYHSAATAKFTGCLAGATGNDFSIIHQSGALTTWAYASQVILKPFVFYPVIWLRGKDDGTNLVFYTSSDGVHWVQLYTETRASFLGTPDSIGVCGIHDNATFDEVATWIHWQVN